MAWQEGVAVLLVCIGLLAGAFIYGRRPSFWIEFGVRAFTALKPKIFEYLRRNTPEVEARMHECIRRGGEWDNFKKRCRDRR
jgi:hypothetical protein